jgi:hypothetical protein
MSSILTVPNGKYFDQIINEQAQLKDIGWNSNIILDQCRYLLASFMKNEKTFGPHLKAGGISWLAIGKGKKSWDNLLPPQPRPTIKKLVDPNPFIIKIQPRQIKYLDAEGNPTLVPTHRIQVEVKLKPGTPPIEGTETTYPLREFGLMAKFGAEDILINYVRHPVIHKKLNDKLIRNIRLVF